MFVVELETAHADGAGHVALGGDVEAAVGRRIETVEGQEFRGGGEDGGAEEIFEFALKRETNPAVLGPYLMTGIDPDFPKKVKVGGEKVLDNLGPTVERTGRLMKGVWDMWTGWVFSDDEGGGGGRRGGGGVGGASSRR